MYFFSCTIYKDFQTIFPAAANGTEKKKQPNLRTTNVLVSWAGCVTYTGVEVWG